MSSLADEIVQQGNLVRTLKADTSTSPDELNAAIEKLKLLKLKQSEINEKLAAERAEKSKFRAGLEDLLLRKFFYCPSFEIYGGVAGLYDYGPTGCKIMNNLQSLWRQHFVLSENMLEVSCSSLTPHVVLHTSGHVERFTDYMVQDVVTNEYSRADKLIEETMESLIAKDDKNNNAYSEEIKRILLTAGAMKKEELSEVIKKYNIKSPDGNDLSEPSIFNLMFQTQIGPTGKFVGYLRPETAQGIFVNFKRLYDYNNHKLPFAAAQIGLAYRNEIAPRAGLLRVREFPLAEIEHFLNPDNKDHIRFYTVKDYKLTLLPKTTNGEMISLTVGEAVDKKIIDNQTLGYFMARTQMFLLMCGILPDRLRFRQHHDDEMSHYAKDCWDAEVLTTYGWIECVGHADRSAYDLRVHSAVSKVDLTAQESYDVPKLVKKLVAKPNRGTIGRNFKAAAANILSYLTNSSQDVLLKLQDELKANNKLILNIDNNTYELSANDISIVEVEEKQSTFSYIPSVIEPSFGLGRIIYSLLEHAYYVRPEDEQRKVLRLTPFIAPVKLAMYNVASNIPYQDVFNKIRNLAIAYNLSFQDDTSKTSIGRKYSRGDEIGIPFAITVDSTSIEQGLVTVRERDSKNQIQVNIEDAVNIINNIVKGVKTWDEVYNTYPKFTFVESNE